MSLSHQAHRIRYAGNLSESSLCMPDLQEAGHLVFADGRPPLCMKESET